jgi:hypothetical protein
MLGGCAVSIVCFLLLTRTPESGEGGRKGRGRGELGSVQVEEVDSLGELLDVEVLQIPCVSEPRLADDASDPTVTTNVQ